MEFETMLNMNSILISSQQADKLAEYYGRVLQKKPEWQDDKIGFTGYLAGSCFISIGPHDKVNGKSANPERIMLNFESKDVEADFERIKTLNGTGIVQEPYHPGGDEKYTMATLSDPDGNFFQLVTPWDESTKPE
ncbi:hypothetical protein HYX70_00405 [Candidatus Saccharibacteria bacterium]|nr:hypothetical protein [Candidatus Saccharibacteria bacterium]